MQHWHGLNWRVFALWPAVLHPLSTSWSGEISMAEYRFSPWRCRGNSTFDRVKNETSYLPTKSEQLQGMSVLARVTSSNGQEVRGWLCRNSPGLLLDFLPQNSCQDVPFYAVWLVVAEHFLRDLICSWFAFWFVKQLNLFLSSHFHW